MTMFIKLDNGQPIGYPITQENMESLFPEFNFNRILTPALINPLGFGIYEFSQEPIVIERYKKKQEIYPPILHENGIYYQQWDIVDMTPEEILQKDLEKAEMVRAERDWLLMSSDYTQLPDPPLNSQQKQAYVLYRQTLRDITNQTGFPWDVIWPTEPI